MRMDRKLSVYESIMESIKRDIALGIFTEGERLPSCRDMAMKLGINPNTVQRAYSELEAQGIIYTIPKKGAFAGKLPESGILATKPFNENNDTINTIETLKVLKKAGLSRDELIKIIDEVYKND